MDGSKFMKLKEKLDFEIAVVVLPTMRFSIVLVSLLLWFRVSSAHDVRSFYCAQFYSGAAVQQTSKNMSLYLSGPLGTSDASTVKTIGQRFHRVVFVKNKNDMWVSRKDAVVNTLTAEGDIRLPIFLLGTKLAAQLGFEIREIGNEQIEILVPDAELLAEKIQKINASLKSRGLDPITYLPTRTGFVTVKETIQLILSAKGDYLVHFPYADLDQVIAPHEVSFHLGAILLSKKIISRSRVLTEETQKLIDLIEQHKEQIGPQYRRLMGQLRIERNFEMDAGLASMVTSPGFTRRDGDMKSYEELLPHISDRYRGYMIRNIEFLNRPRLQPFEATLVQLERITGLDLSDITSADRSDYHAMVIPVPRVGEKVELNPESLNALKKVARLYAQHERPRFETGDARLWLNEYLQSMDQRIKDISDSLPE